MSTTQVDPKTIPDTISLKSTDFICSPAFQCAPLGGLNEYSVDYSAILNAPLGPDGELMNFLWGDPAKIPVYLQQGYQFVPSRCFRGEWNGKQKQLLAASPTIDFSSDMVFKEGRLLVCLWTTATNKRRLDRNNSEAAARAIGGGGRYAETLSGDDALVKSTGSQNSAWSQESFTAVGTPAGLSMAGPVGKK